MSDEAYENVLRLREAWANWNDCKGHNPSMWEGYMTEDVKLFSLSDGDPRTPFTAARQGFAEVELYLEGLVGTFSMDHWRIDDAVAEGDHVIGIGSTGWTHKGTGKSFVTPIIIVTRWRNGRICEYGEYYDTAKIAATTIPN
ncbi:nuclear transport factor 2 family protein [Ruegeria sp. HKCCD8929]|uniref:nuclear transport factor 2 family protein n=1 Tax=Ruegeria sp. HKCCD8929 TaxID=2683006 RepID=UPI001488F14A|nr:nuclear transport factor 2 family protein [Ruegeria sp. HKCCD8929]